MDWLGLVGSLASGIASGFKSNSTGKLLKENEAVLQQRYNWGQKWNNYTQRSALAMWKDTNYPAQVSQMEQAGLSTGLMYGGTSASATSNSGSGTMPDSGINPQEAKLRQQELKQQMLGILSQTMLNFAQAKKANAEAEKTSGVDTEVAEYTVRNLAQDLDNKEEQKKLMQSDEKLKDSQTKLNELLKGKTTVETDALRQNIDNMKASLMETMYRIEGASVDLEVKQRTKESLIQSVALDNSMKIADILNRNMDTKLKGQQIQMIGQQMLAIGVDMAYKQHKAVIDWAQISVQLQQLGFEKEKLEKTLKQGEKQMIVELGKAVIGSATALISSGLMVAGQVLKAGTGAVAPFIIPEPTQLGMTMGQTPKLGPL